MINLYYVIESSFLNESSKPYFGTLLQFSLLHEHSSKNRKGHFITFSCQRKLVLDDSKTGNGPIHFLSFPYLKVAYYDSYLKTSTS